jgi:hypothetical protein
MRRTRKPAKQGRRVTLGRLVCIPVHRVIGDSIAHRSRRCGVSRGGRDGLGRCCRCCCCQCSRCRRRHHHCWSCRCQRRGRLLLLIAAMAEGASMGRPGGVPLQRRRRSRRSRRHRIRRHGRITVGSGDAAQIAQECIADGRHGDPSRKELADLGARGDAHHAGRLRHGSTRPDKCAPRRRRRR